MGLVLAFVGGTYAAGAPGLQDLDMLAPGRGTILVGTISRMGAVAIAWTVAQSLDELGQDGAFLVAVPGLMLAVVDWHVASFAIATTDAFDALSTFASPLLPPAIILLGIGVRRPVFPIQVYGTLQLRTVVPLLVFPLALSTFVMLQANQIHLLEALGSMPTWSLVIAAHAVGTGVALWLVNRSSSGGVLVVPAVLGLVVGLCMAAASVGLMAIASPYASAWKRAYAGRGHVQIRVAYDSPLSASDLQVLQERLVEAGEVRITRDGPSQLLVDVAQTDTERVLDHLDRSTRPGHLGLHPVDPSILVSDLKTLIAQGVQGKPETWPALPRGLSWGIEGCPEPDGSWRAVCRVYALQPAALTDADIEAANVVYSEYGGPGVSVALTEDGARRFGELTTRIVDQQLAIVLDDEVVSAPMIAEPIWGGRVHITLSGRGKDVEDQAHALAAALRLERLAPRRRTMFEVTHTTR